MTASELARQCREQLALAGPQGSVVLSLPGRWGKTNRKRLCKGGPWGSIVADDVRDGPGRVLVSFVASEVLAFVEGFGGGR